MNLYLLAILTSAIQVGIGAAIGVWWSRRRASLASRLDATWARELVERLQTLAGGVVDDLGRHHTKLQKTSERLTTAQRGLKQAPLTEAVAEAVRDVLNLNSDLSNRLSSAETKLQEQTRQIETYLSEARTDSLTGLPNRRALNDELSRCIAQNRRRREPVSLVMFDVDEFKRVNDLHGHLIGDKLLEEIAAIMRAMFRGGDMPARFGGEEFAVVLPDADGGRAKTIAERIRTTIEQRKFDFDGLAVSASVSVGVAEWIEGEDSTAFLRRADRAMYASKQAGRNCGHFHDGLITLRIRGAEENKAGSQSNQAEASPIEEDRPRFSAELAQACEGLRRELAKVNDDE